MSATHRCPGGCGRQVPDRMFACRPHWYQLPKKVRDDIWATVGLPLSDTDRREAIGAAIAVYGDAAPPEWRGYPAVSE